MYLLNTSTLQLEQPRGYPKYAILSHVWAEEEVTFSDINAPHAVRLEGYAKIERCCAQALTDGYQYVWIDTCCIDKSSSAELSEAINSMYRWYEDAAVCYAYLADVPSDENPAYEHSSFRCSRYFRRGWTLQEVIAPERVEFFARDWVKIATKASEISVIAEVTGVDRRVLSKSLPLTEVSVAKKMSWASQRETTRVEDRAYSLMGIFGVHVPLLYGEGENAFIRLQHEIMRTSNDQSIFVWGLNDDQAFPLLLSKLDSVRSFASSPLLVSSPLLASSPSDFCGCAEVDRIMPNEFSDLFASSLSKDTPYKSQFSMTNSGVQIILPIKRTPFGYIAALACVDTWDTESCFIGLALNLDRDGVLRRGQWIGCTAEQEPRDEYLLKDITIATHCPFSPPRSARLPSISFYLVNLDFRSAIQEGFVLSSPPLGKPNSLKHGEGRFMWEAWQGSESMLAFRNEIGMGFVVTIGSWVNLCVHVTVTPVPYSPSHIAIDTGYDLPDHILADGSRGCESAPDWASQILPFGRRVTVTCSLGYVTISVGRPMAHRCVNEKSRSRSGRLRIVRSSGVGFLEGRASAALTSRVPRDSGGSESTAVRRGKRKEREGESDLNGPASDDQFESASATVVAPVFKKRGLVTSGNAGVVSDRSKSASPLTSARRQSWCVDNHQTAEGISNESRNERPVTDASTSTTNHKVDHKPNRTKTGALDSAKRNNFAPVEIIDLT